MSFNLSQRSLRTLEGVHPDLVAIVKRAITITEEDFLVGCGVRTIDKQREYVLTGKSKTMNSRHLVVNGYSHAVDLWLWKEGKISWDTSNADSFYEVSHDDDYVNYQEIGTSMIQAARELRVHLSKAVPVSLILAIVTQTVVVIWFMATLNNDVEHNKKTIESLQNQSNLTKTIVNNQEVTLGRIDENLKNVRILIERFTRSQ